MRHFNEILLGIPPEEHLLMCALRVPNKLPLRQNPCDARFHTYGAGKGCEVKQVDTMPLIERCHPS